MSEFVKKSALGYKAVPESEPGYTHVILTRQEYNQMLNAIERAEDKAVAAEVYANAQIKAKTTEFENELSRYQSEAEALVSATKTEYEQKLLTVRNEAQEYQNKARRQEILNRNLKRIALERANQKRGIRPKKDHDGYLVLKSQQYTERWTKENDYDKWLKENPKANKKDFVKVKHHSAEVWKSVVQTPYDASIPLQGIEETIMNELWDGGVLNELGCLGMIKPEYNGTYYTFRDENKQEQNGMYKWTYMANYRSGFWEVTIYTTKELTVPVFRRPSG